MSAKSSVNILLFAFGLIFFLVNGFFIISLFTKLTANTASSQRYKIQIIIDDKQVEQVVSDKSITYSDNFFLKNGTTEIYALAGSNFDYSNNNIKINSGTLYIIGSNLSFQFNNKSFTIADSFQAILDIEEGLVLTEGSPRYNNENEDLNTQFQLINENFEQYQFDRKLLSSEDKYKNLLSFINSLEIKPEYFVDMTGPEINSTSPRDGFITTERYIRFFAYTEPTIKVSVNSEESTSDQEGYFTRQIDLEVGNNPVNIVAKDKYGNSTLMTITYTRKGVSIPASYPNSFPVSYNN